MAESGGEICPQCQFQNTASRDRCARCGAVISPEAKERSRKVMLIILGVMLIPTTFVLSYPFLRPMLGGGTSGSSEAPIDREMTRAREAVKAENWLVAQSAASTVLKIDPNHSEAQQILDTAQQKLATTSRPDQAAREKKLKQQILEADQKKDWKKVQTLARSGLESTPDDTFYSHYFKRARGHLALDRAKSAFAEGKIDQARSEAGLARQDGVSDSALDQDLEMHDIYMRARGLLDQGELAATHDLLLDYRNAAGEIGRLANFVDAIFVAQEEIANGNYARALLFFDDARRRLPKSPYVSETLAMLRKAHPWLVPELVFESSGRSGLGTPLSAAITPGGTHIVFVERRNKRYHLVMVSRVSRRVLWRKAITYPIFANSLAIVCSPNGELMAVSSTEGSIGLHSLAKEKQGEPLQVVRPPEGVMGQPVFSAGNRMLYFLDGTGQAVRMDVRSGNVVPAATAGSDRFTEIAISPNGEYMMAIEPMGELNIWKMTRLDKPIVVLRSVEERREGRFTASSRSFIYLEANTGLNLQRIGELQGIRVTKGDFSDAGVLTAPGVLAIWRRSTSNVDVYNASSGKHLSYFKTGFRKTDTMRLSFDGSYLLGVGVVAGTAQTAIRVWSVGR